MNQVISSTRDFMWGQQETFNIYSMISNLLGLDELAGGGSPWEALIGCSTASPVNCATGEFWHTFDDLEVPGRGLPLSLTRTYSSRRAGDLGPMGYAWSHSYNIFLTLDSGNNATIQAGNGSRVTFNLVNGSYQAAPRVLASLVKNGDGTFTLTDKAKTQLVFDASGKLTRETDRNGYNTTLSYSGGKLSTVTEPSGRTLTFSYGGNGLVSAVSDTASRTVRYTYDGSNNLTQATDVANGATTFAYDGSHQLLTMKDPNCIASGCPGVVNTYTNGQVTTQSDGMSRNTTFAYTPETTTVTDPRGSKTFYEWGKYILMARTSGSGSSSAAMTSFAYDAASLGVIRVTDANGHAATATRDAQGNLLSATDADARTTSYAYNSFSEPLTVKDPLGVTTTNLYDANGNLTDTSRPLAGSGQTASYHLSYDGQSGDVTRVRDPDLKTWSYGYDANGNRTSWTDPLGNKTTASYDGVGRRTASVSPRGNATGSNPAAFTTTYVLNAFGDTTSMTDPLSHQTQYGYDPDRNLTSVKDATNHSTTYTYDLDNELTQVTRADNSTLKTGYDSAGNVTSQTDGLNNPTSYGYDALNRLTSMTDPLSRSTQYGYDLAGNPTSKTDPMSRTTTYTSDPANQVIGITYSNANTPNVTIGYDQDGQRVSMTDGTGTSTYTWDSLHRLTQSKNGAGAVVGYSYDLKGQLTGITYPNSVGTVSRGYDDAGRLHTVTDWLSHTSTFNYNPDSNLVQVLYPNGVQGTATFDNADRLTQITDTAGSNQFLNLSYQRDNINQLTTENSTVYGNDQVNRLNTAGNLTYAYDNADRLTQIAAAGGNTTNLAYDNGSQLQTKTVMSGSTQVSKLTYGYDPDGNRTQQTDQNNVTIALGFDQANRLISYGANASYKYDGGGLRASKTVGGSTTNETWDLAEGLPLLIQDGTTNYVTGPGGLPLEQIAAANSVSYYHADQLGSTRALTDAQGNVVSTYSYDPYGNTTASTGTIANPLQHAGQYLDSESGLYYLRARYYDPSSTQFISRDPAVSKTRQPYAYVTDNPLNATDPSGLDCSFMTPWDCGSQLAHGVLEVASSVPYSLYYVAYRSDSSLLQAENEVGPLQGFGHVANLPGHGVLDATQWLNLHADIGIDCLKMHVGGERQLNDEGFNGHIGPFGTGPIWYLPGWHADDASHVDYSWNHPYPWSRGLGTLSSKDRP
jgi:RHS repeat-associated protein